METHEEKEFCEEEIHEETETCEEKEFCEEEICEGERETYGPAIP